MIDRLYNAFIIAAAWLILGLRLDLDPPADEPVRCDGGMELQAGDIPLDPTPLLDEYPLPDAFQRWIDGKNPEKG